LEPRIRNPLVFGTTFSIFAIIILIAISPIATDTFETTGYNDGSVLKGFFTITQSDADGNIIRTIQTDNLVVNEGMECVADLTFGTTSCVAEAFFQFVQVLQHQLMVILLSVLKVVLVQEYKMQHQQLMFQYQDKEQLQ